MKELFIPSHPTAIQVIWKLSKAQILLNSTFMAHDSPESMMMLPCGCTNTLYGSWLRWLIRPRRPDYCGALVTSCHQDLTWPSPNSLGSAAYDHCVWSSACPVTPIWAAHRSGLIWNHCVQIVYFSQLRNISLKISLLIKCELFLAVFLHECSWRRSEHLKR